METSIYGLSCEFKYQNEQSIMFYEKDGKELTTDDFNSVQLKMIQSNRIPYLLPLTVENMDLSAKLFYDIQSKSKIISYLRNNQATMNDYYQLFLSIVKALEDSNSYMLNQEQYILHTDFIFVGKNAGDVYMAYLPIENLERETTALDDIKQLLTDIAGEVEGLQGNEFKSILNYIRSHNFSLSGLKKLLIDLMSLRPNVQQQQRPQMSAGAMQMENGESAPKVNGAVTNNDSEKASNGNQQQKVVAGSENSNVKKKKVLPKLTSREMVYLFASVVMGLAIMWKIYEMFPNTVMLIVSSVVSVAMIAAGVVYWKFWRPGVEPEVKTVVSKSTNNKQGDTTVSKDGVQSKSQTQVKTDSNGQNFNQAQNAPSGDQMNQQQPMNQPAGMPQGWGADPSMSHQFQQQMNQDPNPMSQQQTNPYASPEMPPQPEENRGYVSFQQQMNQNPETQQSGVANNFGQPDVEPGHAFAAATEDLFDTANADDTVLLDEEDDMPDSQDQNIQMPFLIRTAENGQTEAIQVDQTNFLIGRNDDSVNYVDKTTGVSRLHAEIIRIDASSYGIKDLGSKNGSKLNGETMVPYKVYALNEEDVFYLGKASYTFTWSADQ